MNTGHRKLAKGKSPKNSLHILSAEGWKDNVTQSYPAQPSQVSGSSSHDNNKWQLSQLNCDDTDGDDDEDDDDDVECNNVVDDDDRLTDWQRLAQVRRDLHGAAAV